LGLEKIITPQVAVPHLISGVDGGTGYCHRQGALRAVFVHKDLGPKIIESAGDFADSHVWHLKQDFGMVRIAHPGGRERRNRKKEKQEYRKMSHHGPHYRPFLPLRQQAFGKRAFSSIFPLWAKGLLPYNELGN